MMTSTLRRGRRGGRERASHQDPLGVSFNSAAGIQNRVKIELLIPQLGGGKRGEKALSCEGGKGGGNEIECEHWSRTDWGCLRHLEGQGAVSSARGKEEEFLAAGEREGSSARERNCPIILPCHESD